MKYQIGDIIKNTSGFIGTIVDIIFPSEFPYVVNYGDQIVRNRETSIVEVLMHWPTMKKL